MPSTDATAAAITTTARRSMRKLYPRGRDRETSA
jgi:hypothetical protein